MRSEFARLVRDDPRIDRSLSSFLARAYDLKSVADYAVEPEIGVSMAEADEAIDLAVEFVHCINVVAAD